MSEITQKRLRELVDYDPSTGVFTRKIRHWCAKKGQIAGCRTPDGRLCFRVDGKLYLAHRLAWLYVHGKLPVGVIDHINGDHSDNRIENLRDVPRVVNQQNLRKAMAGSQTKLLGASPHGSGFRAEIRVGGVKKYLGTYRTAEEAHRVYVDAKRKMHEGCTI
jgi:hypothetical protein